MCIIENIQRKEIDGIYIQHVECAIKKNDMESGRGTDFLNALA